MAQAEASQFGALAPGRLERAILKLTTPLPDTWLGLRLAMILRRVVIKQLAYPDGALDVERWGIRMRLHPRDNGCEKNLLFTPRMYEPMELGELKADIVRAKDRDEPFVFIDIGANVGLFSLFVAATAGKTARILAIEPESGNLRRLDFNLQANPGIPIKVIPTALSDKSGRLSIALDRRDRGGTRTTRIDQAGLSPDGSSVPAQALLEVLSNEGIDAVNALKIDVEGFEEVILPPFFRDAPPRLWPELVIIEDGRKGWKVDLIGLMLEKGYALTAQTTHQNLILRRMPDRASAGPEAR